MGTDYQVILRELTLVGIGEVPGVGAVLGAVVGLLWPESSEDVWDEIKAQVETLIDEKIAVDVMAKVTGNLEGLNGVLANYLAALKDGDLEEIARRYDDADTTLDLYRPNFQQSGYELLLLSLFAQFANLHLFLLHDGVNFGKSWGWTDETVKTATEKLATKVADYGSWVGTYYQAGLTAVTGSVEPSLHSNQPFAASNAYIRGMTLDVLDLSNLWPYFVNGVPVPPNPLPREIYSDPLGTGDDGPAIPLPFAQPPTQPMIGVRLWGDSNLLYAILVAYQANGGPDGISDTGIQGHQERVNGALPPYGGQFAPDPANQITSCTVWSGDVIQGMQFQFADGTGSQHYGGTGGGTSTWAYDGHLLSSIYVASSSASYNLSIGSLVLGFRYGPPAPPAETARRLFVASPAALSPQQLHLIAPDRFASPDDLESAAADGNWQAARTAFWRSIDGSARVPQA